MAGSDRGTHLIIVLSCRDEHFTCRSGRYDRVARIIVLIITETESVHAWIEKDGAYIHVECIQKVYWLSRVLPAYNKAAAW